MKKTDEVAGRPGGSAPRRPVFDDELSTMRAGMNPGVADGIII